MSKDVIFSIILGITFLWASSSLVMKYAKRSTLMTERKQKNGKILFPSISFCPTAIYSKFTNNSLKTVNLTEEIINTGNFSTWVSENLSSRQETVQYLSHQGILKDNFPCNMVSGSQELNHFFSMYL